MTPPERDPRAAGSDDHGDPTGPFDADYYRGNGQDADRPALRYYTRLVRRYGGAGPYLDYGCGTGWFLKHLGELGPADGFEVSEWSAATARATAPGARVWTDPAELPEHHYGVLTAVHVVEHLEQEVLDASLRTWRRVLRPGGRVLVATPDLDGRAHRLVGEEWSGFSDPTHINLRGHAAWRSTFETAGFHVVRAGSDGLWDPPYGRAPRLVDAARRTGPALAQYLSGRLVLPVGTGESVLFVLAVR